MTSLEIVIILNAAAKLATALAHLVTEFRRLL
jgi:hypothetical protein